LEELGVTKKVLKQKWTKPELKRLGELKDVRAGTNPAAANGAMS
jgi:hypothetical protein